MGKMFDLPRMSQIELQELLDDLALSLQTRHGYTRASNDMATSVPALPTGFVNERLLSQNIPGGHRVLRIGCWSYRSRTPRLGVYGAILLPGQAMQANPDQAGVDTLVKDTLASMEQMRKSLSAVDLEHKVIQLSYVDVKGALSALQGMGIHTVDSASQVPQEVEFSRLPMVLEMAPPPTESTGLVGKSETAQGQFGSALVPTLASDLNADTITSPATRLMVLFHPAHPEQFSRIQSLIDEVIDRPARQIYVEAMVLEITSAGLKQLGIEWEFHEGKFSVSGGSANADLDNFANLGKTLFFTGTNTQDLAREWLARIRALLIDGTAEVLSRPSVLALNNRQASVRIGTDIPIATSQEGLSSGASKISFDFKYLALGILLNIRPRVSEDGREISLMVDTVVSSRIPEADLEIRDEDGRLLASAPQVTTRRVQTYARIQNNTPFVIGGLVSRNDTRVTEKVPFLGDLPGLGNLFRTKSRRDLRSEVIIVLTPYVLPEKLHLSRALPKQTEFMDDKDSALFRRSYRILTQDVYDVSSLYTNRRFQHHRNLAKMALQQDYRLAEQAPFFAFAEGRLPGEKIITQKIIYNTLERLGFGPELGSNQMFLLTDLGPGRYETEYLDSFLAKMPGGDNKDASFFSTYPDRALAISFYNPYESPDGMSLISDPVPKLEIVSCPGRQAWKRLLWQLNQPDQNGRKRYTILIHRPEDVLRLQRSIMTGEVLHINGGGGPEASLRNFIPGRILEIPSFKADHPRPINADAARFFFHSTAHYYTAAAQEIDHAVEQLDAELQRPEFRQILQDQPEPAE